MGRRGGARKNFFTGRLKCFWIKYKILIRERFSSAQMPARPLRPRGHLAMFFPANKSSPPDPVPLIGQTPFGVGPANFIRPPDPVPLIGRTFVGGGGSYGSGIRNCHPPPPPTKVKMRILRIRNLFGVAVVEKRMRFFKIFWLI